MEWLRKLQKVIPTIILGGSFLCNDRYLSPMELKKAGNMLNTIGRTAMSVGETLMMTNMAKVQENISQNCSPKEVKEAVAILTFYADTLKPPYDAPIRQAIQAISRK